MKFTRRGLPLLLLLLVSVGTPAQQNPDGQLPISNYENPLVLLLRDDEVLRELRTNSEQRSRLEQLSDRLDAVIWPARNKSAEVAAAVWAEATATAQDEAARILTPPQRQRLEEIILWIQGTRSLRRDDVAERLALTPKQRVDIQAAAEKTQATLADLQRRAADGEPTGPLQELARRRNSEEQLQVIQVLSDEQKRNWVKLVGPKIDVAKLGYVNFYAPPLIASTSDWLNAPAPLDHKERRVTVVHFFANGCVNCQRNYEHYRAWHDAFGDQGLVIIGIHTPETEEEHDLELLRRRVADAELHFPILIDNEKKNWDAWGNSMWPMVYLVDHQGRIRYWWQGELNWQSADGEQRMRQRITELLAETSGRSP